MTATNHERGPEDQQQVGQDRADQRGLYDRDEPGPHGEEADEQLRQVAQGALQHAGRASSEPVSQTVNATADQGCEQRDRDRRADERNDGPATAVPGQASHDNQDRAAGHDDPIGSGEPRPGRRRLNARTRSRNLAGGALGRQVNIAESGNSQLDCPRRTIP
jgi:hypothetical protein